MLTVALASLFCAAVFFMAVESASPLSNKHETERFPAYQIYCSSDFDYENDVMHEHLIPEKAVEQMRTIQGMVRVDPYILMKVELNYAGSESSLRLPLRGRRTKRSFATDTIMCRMMTAYTQICMHTPNL